MLKRLGQIILVQLLIAITCQLVALEVRATEKEAALTGRELEVLALVGRGLGNQELARSLGLSVKAVEMHLSSIYQKLEAENRTQAALYSYRMFRGE